MSKRINATITDEQFQLISDSGLSNSEIVSEALTFFFEHRDEHSLLASEREMLKSENQQLKSEQTLSNAHIETLKQEIETLKKQLEDVKNMYNSHVLQVQTLINQKTLEEAKKPWWRFW
jgi:hypothetical protein